MIPTTEAIEFSMGQSIFFWCCAVFMVVCAIGMAVFKKAVHSAVAMIGVMLGLAGLYVSLGAVFLGVVQVVVYTGAIMMMILFVIMMVGVAASDNYRRSARWLRGLAWLGGITGVALIGYGMFSNQGAGNGPGTGHDQFSNPVIVAFSLFSGHLFTLELVGVLLVIAAVGAITLTHSDRLTKVFKQPETAEAKMQMYAQQGTHIGPLPAPGVYAESNAADVPALSGETGEGIEASVPRVLRLKGMDRSIAQVSPSTALAVKEERLGNDEKGLHTVAASQSIEWSGAWGMPGEKVESGLAQPQTVVVNDGVETQPDTAEHTDQEASK